MVGVRKRRISRKWRVAVFEIRIEAVAGSEQQAERKRRKRKLKQ